MMSLTPALVLPIRTALIGFGYSGATFHAPFLKVLPDFLVTHVVSGKHEEIQACFPHTQIVSHNDVEILLESTEIDLVIITAPNAEHFRLAKKALEFGKHVVVEKPFVLTLEEGNTLISLAKKQNKILTVYHNRRWDSDFLTIQKIINLGVLGKISSLSIRYDRYRPRPKTERWKESSHAGSGTLWDLGAHLIHQALLLFGMPQHLIADMARQRENAKTIDFFNIMFIYSNQMRVQLSSSSLCLSPGPKYEVYGQRGSFIKFGQDPQEQALVNKIIPNAIDFGKESTTFSGKLSSLHDEEIVHEFIPSSIGCYVEFFKQLSEAMQYNRLAPVQPEQALNVIKIIKLCEESNRLRKSIQLSRFTS